MSDNIKKVYQAFLKAGFSEKQAKALTAEVGRENAYQSKYIFGHHTDMANSADNLGFFSWQGERKKNLLNKLQQKGLYSNGRISESQESLNTMAEFAKEEMENIGSYKKTKEGFLKNPNISQAEAAELLGRNYLRWDMDGKYIKNVGEHKKRRDKFYSQISGEPYTEQQYAESSQTTPQEQPQAGYIGMLPNGLPDVYGQPYVAEEETKTETVEAPKRTENANKLGFVADYEELSKQYEQQLQAQQNPIIQQEIVEGVQYQPIQQNFQEGGIKIDPQGYWNPNNEGKPVIIPSPEITMKGIDYPIYGKSLETGEVKLMTPNNEYFFANTQNVLEQPVNFQIGGEFVEIDRGNGKIEKINTDSDEYRTLYGEGRVLGREGDTLLAPKDLNEVTITAFRKTNSASLEPKVQIDEQELQQRLENPYNFETQKDATSVVKEETLPGIKAGQKLEDVKKVLKDTTYEQKFNTVDKNNLSYSDLSSLSKEEKDKVVQQTLIENNILKQKPRNQQETTSLQKELLQSGYDLGKYGANKDGVDGQFGDKTNKALENYNNKILENGEELAINILKRKDADTFTNTLQKNDNFFTLSSDEGIKDYQKQYYDKGYFRNKQSDFNFNFSDKDLKKNYKVFSTNFVKPYESETSCYGEECASFVTLDVLNNLKSFYGEEQGGKIFDENQVRGDAWTMNSSIVKNGGETLYNVLGKKPESVKNVKSFVEDKIKSSQNIDSKKLKAGDIVHMYYEKSGNFDKAYKEGDDIFSTHVGILKEDDKGNLVVEHNVHGKVYKNKITDFNNKYAKAGSSKIAITGISRPKYNKKDGKDEKVEYIETSSVNKLNTDYVSNKNSPFFKEVLPLAQESLSVNKNKILSDIPISSKEYDNLEKAIISIMWKESYGNVKVDNPDLKGDNYEAYLKKSFAPIAEKVFNRESSKGLTQLKGDKNINSVIKSNILKNEEDLYDPKKSAVVSLYSLSSKYIYLRDLVAKEDLKISPDELTKLAMLSWNEPINKVGESLSKYKNFDKTWEAYNKNSTHAYSKAFSLYDKAFSKRISSK
jgi:hypothetical protein